jgi:3-hydroxyisobutyrate dehydrogenase
MKKLKIGFIGLGLMGKPMAQNLLKNNFELSVYNRTYSKTKELENKGAMACKSPCETANNSDVVVIMVTGPKDVKEIIFGKNGISKSSNKRLTVIDMSTIGPSNSREIHDRLKSIGIAFLDAPVTGSTPAAKSGQLIIFVGGEKIIFLKCEKILKAMGKKVMYIGPAGSGQAIKLANNLLIGLAATAAAEAMLLADAEGLPRGKVMKFLDQSPVVSDYIRMKMKNMANNDYSTLFSIRNIHKDLGLAILEADKNKSRLPNLSMAERIFRKSIRSGLGEKDISSVIKYIKKEMKKK